MGVRNGAYHGVIESVVVGAVAVEGDATNGRPGLSEDPVRPSELLDVAVGEVGMDLDLITAGITAQ
jgi:hypothetical protein